VLHDWDPEIGFLGEENGAFGDVNTRWVLDPMWMIVRRGVGDPSVLRRPATD
jgi:hypothetical protein